ncbi:glucose 1-dehydrogenase [Thalassotalea sp. LPB0316]|uniref:SDR family NAD(P)-dependent oxidoreductase n=1 Tax=Thalassotalea sp. LPB0316 TaxID=2769490 RepID=UPI001868CADF|nr:glucose 1-dehydrogenase [Thalassotalea sp. LPB0316]QOL25820.1 glucose 1-dehydrogenase [Thalassotalea sp. LPB0316]
MDSLLDFSDKVVLVTGAAQGFGKLLSIELAKRGAKLVIGDIKADQVQAVGDEIAATGAQVYAMSCNVAKADDCKAMVDKAVEVFGKLDIAVNNAGIAHHFGTIHEIDEAVMDQQFAVNVKGVQLGMKYQLSQMLQHGGGSILNVSSMAGLGGAPLAGAYAAAKHAVIGLTKTAAVEYAKKNIRVNAICPFFTLTPMVTNIADEELQQNLGRRAPIGRLAEPQEVVNTMLLMLSPGNTYLTGQCIAVDGGVSAI